MRLVRQMARITLIIFATTFLISFEYVEFAGSCFDSCPDKPRYVVLEASAILALGALMALITCAVFIYALFSEKRYWQSVLALFLLAVICTLLVILLTSINGDALFPRTYKMVDPWIVAWYGMVALMVLWPIILYYGSSHYLRDTGEPASAIGGSQASLLRITAMIGWSLYLGYLGGLVTNFVARHQVIPQRFIIFVAAPFAGPPENGATYATLAEHDAFARTGGIAIGLLAFAILFVPYLRSRKAQRQLPTRGELPLPM